MLRARRRLNILKYISGRDWEADAITLRNSYISLIRPILEYEYPIYCCASDTNLQRLERVQLSAARIITDLRNSCPKDIVLYEANLQPPSLRRMTNLVKFYNKLYSLDSRNRTFAYLKVWCNNQRLKANSPFSQVTTCNLITNTVEQHHLTQGIDPSMGLPGVFSVLIFLFMLISKKTIPPI
ncbi:hypothetical protein AVEN_5174-1 [Araneus ventricosus]|uniref:Uncharacterized protein n=1 Tax=Araneus ventricosus TaxID=182803 RepID=A0A4Y2HTF3_ARAVE|nr:hypothetical protein AVEN_5174-1 [Araneus ventricosus]